MGLRHGLVVGLAVAAVACGGEPDRAAGDEEAASAQPSAPQILTGFLTVEEAPVITQCGTNEEFTVDGPAFADLLDLHGALAPGVEPLEGVFVDVLGEFVEGSRGPVVEVVEVRRAAWEGGGCGDAEPDLVFRADGTEPFWSLTVSRETMTWRTPEGQETLEHRGAYRSDRGDWLVDGTVATEASGGANATGAEPALTARFYPEPCQNAMSGAWFHMSVEVSFRGRELQGCAYTGQAFAP